MKYKLLFLLSQQGTLRRSKPATNTLVSRLRDLWRHISRSIERFEQQSDTGRDQFNFFFYFKRFYNKQHSLIRMFRGLLIDFGIMELKELLELFYFY